MPKASRGASALSYIIPLDIMGAIVLGMDGKRLKYTQLIADNGLDSGARA